MINIAVADDHAIVREGFKQILSASEINVSGEAETGQGLLDLVSKNNYDMVVLDISLPDRSGLDVLKELKKTHPELPVLVLTMHAEEQYALRVFKAGASGYLTKDSAPAQLVKAIEKVTSGGKYVSHSLAEKLVLDIGDNGARPLHETLSDREFQVLTNLASGKTAGQIATELGLSVKTVSTYRTRILEKMHLRNNAELIHYAIQNKLV
ncbi:MAG: response regulator transcription factor [Bdellovibrionaceae bacterium]|nr:response regulator transcription factor [Pseudobdellovibrionaceae bacterium]